MDALIFHADHQTRGFVYRNLHQDCWSVKALSGPNAGRVVLHAATVWLHGATFRVNEAGRQRVLKEQRKNVHAGVVGYVYHAHVITERYDVGPTVSLPIDMEAVLDESDHLATDPEVYRPVTYNPYKFDRFVWADDLSEADAGDRSVALAANGKVYVMDTETLIRKARLESAA
jgi:hypothetical protein